MRMQHDFVLAWLRSSEGVYICVFERGAYVDYELCKEFCAIMFFHRILGNVSKGKETHTADIFILLIAESKHVLFIISWQDTGTQLIVLQSTEQMEETKGLKETMEALQ